MKSTVHAWMALAVGLCALGAGLGWVVAVREPQSAPREGSEGMAPTDVDGSSANPASAEVDLSQMLPGELVETQRSLRAAYEANRDAIPEEVADPVEDDLNIIERGIADILTAIASEPNDESLRRMLVATYRNEVKLLKKALHLSSDMEEEELDLAIE